MDIGEGLHQVDSWPKWAFGKLWILQRYPHLYGIFSSRKDCRTCISTSLWICATKKRRNRALPNKIASDMGKSSNTVYAYPQIHVDSRDMVIKRTLKPLSHQQDEFLPEWQKKNSCSLPNLAGTRILSFNDRGLTRFKKKNKFIAYNTFPIISQ